MRRQDQAWAVLLLAGLALPATARPDLYSNGPFITHSGQATGGADACAMQAAIGMSSYGFLCQQIPANARLADDFVVPAGGWTVSSVVFYQFQAGAAPATPTITSINLRVWNGRPGATGATVVFGNTTTNRLASVQWAGAYRVPDTDFLNTNRAIFRVEATIDPPLLLNPGSYWLDWQSSGSLASGPWSVPVTVLGQTGPANANGRWFDGTTWTNLRDTASNSPQDLTFVIRGTPGTGSAPCAANCDGSTTIPILNVNDFVCFQSLFAAGASNANCDGSTTPPVLNVNDFICFQSLFAAGCSAP
jgi:hypothetical protein